MATSTDASSVETAHFYGPNIAHNKAVLANIFFATACLSGFVSGILGLQNVQGFILFGAATLLNALFVGGVKMEKGVGRYVMGGWKELLVPAQDNLFSFVLVWTLVYGVVHGELS
ncbi:hypothetical protein SISSUDRAFT_1048401 [Sistotremastrum suecicum HHB10207 ss-3]|uniref:ER membrane protein complex subunit 6 n=1 Tax=Sistotremastrum suecicum HHB10207 ss-3 TaxID=1314776 RepID=A0A166CJP5_9AGAM|nr:hypothetical protein SISSUDRAFT_1048401 [Sistotremastrum suecicum HHB10207 ss-3]